MTTTIHERYVARTPESARLHTRATSVMPGGDTRAIGWFPPYPPTMVRGAGAEMWDADGNRYHDLLGNYTSLVHGHAYPPVVDAVRRQAGDGSVWPARNIPQIELAEILCERVAAVERIRFCNSGTEAAMLALRIARLATGRDRVLMARFGYHGQMHELECGSHGESGPSTLLAPYGDTTEFGRVLAEAGDSIAAVFLEPVMGSAGIVAAPPGFLPAVADATERAGALLACDEVITFRLASGGAQELSGVRPDLTTFGKLIGGGFPVGAVGGRADVMSAADPSRGGFPHSGTYNGNPVTAVAGTIAVRDLTGERIEQIGALALRLAEGIAKSAADAGLPCTVNHTGSLLNVYLSDPPAPLSPERTDGDLIAAFHLACLNHGVLVAPRGMMATSTALTDALVDEALDGIAEAMRDVAGVA